MRPSRFVVCLCALVANGDGLAAGVLTEPEVGVARHHVLPREAHGVEHEQSALGEVGGAGGGAIKLVRD